MEIISAGIQLFNLHKLHSMSIYRRQVKRQKRHENVSRPEAIELFHPYMRQYFSSGDNSVGFLFGFFLTK
jgi:hypothetical protein